MCLLKNKNQKDKQNQNHYIYNDFDNGIFGFYIFHETVSTLTKLNHEIQTNL